MSNTEFDSAARPSLGRLAKEIQLHRKMVANGILGSCVSCEHFSGSVIHRKDEPGVCHLYNAKPPLDTVVFGCDSYTWDLPF